jgi:CubicO group peptidase (beta-lactamase class C family)
MKTIKIFSFLSIVFVLLIGTWLHSQVNPQTSLPTGITKEQMSAYQIRPTHLQNIQSDKEVEQVSFNYTRANNKPMPDAKATFNSDVFAKKFHAAIKDEVTGYAMQLRLNGAPNHSLYWNWALTPANGGIGWHLDRRMHVASVSKLITAIAMLKLLDEKGISLDASIINYLPDYWEKGNKIDQVSFRNLLQHRSGFSTGGSASDFGTMKAKVSAGVNEIGKYDYENMNFGLCRILIAVINGDINKNYKSPPFFNFNDEYWDFFTIRAYANYVQTKVFNPAGVAKAGFVPADFGALAYNFPHGNLDGWNSGDLSTMSGGVGWRLSVIEVLNVMNHARRKNTILSANRMQFLLDNGLGIDQIIKTPAGKLYNKNGSWERGSKCANNLSIEQCVAVFLPNGYEIVVFVNSRIGMDCKSLRNLVTETYLDSFQ